VKPQLVHSSRELDRLGFAAKGLVIQTRFWKTDKSCRAEMKYMVETCIYSLPPSSGLEGKDIGSLTMQLHDRNTAPSRTLNAKKGKGEALGEKCATTTQEHQEAL
jgi:hypothetical protein